MRQGNTTGLHAASAYSARSKVARQTGNRRRCSFESRFEKADRRGELRIIIVDVVVVVAIAVTI